MPYSNFHACRINDPDKYEKIRYDKNALKVNNKSVDVLYGIKDGSSEIQSYRYPKESFSEDEARDHCSKKDGSFEPAKKTSSAMRYISRSDWAIHEDELHNILSHIKEDAGVFFDVGDSPYTDPEVEDRTAKIELVGPLFKYSNVLTVIGMGTSLENASYQLDKAHELKKKGQISNVQLQMDTPGGQASGIDAFSTKIQDLKDELNITTQVSGMCCSGGYWIASATNGIYPSSDTDIFGSVGVIMRLMDKPDDEQEIVSSNAPNKSPDPKTDEGYKTLKDHVDKLEQIFIQKVATYRNTTVKDVKDNYGKGGILYTQEAIQAGMIDQQGGKMDITAKYLKENHNDIVNELVQEAIAEKDQEITQLKERLQEPEQNLPDEARAEINKYREQVESMEKEFLEEKLNYCSQEARTTLLGFYGKLDKNDIQTIGDIIKTYQDTIDEMGRQYSTTASPSNEDPEAEKERQVANKQQEFIQQGYTEYSAYLEAYKQIHQ